MSLAHRQSEPSGHGTHLARRAFLGAVVGISAGAVVGRVRTFAHAHAAASAAPSAEVLHGAQLRGMYLTTQNRLAEGRFGVMFKKLPPFAPSDDLLQSLARTMVEDQTVPDDSLLNTSP